MSATTEIPILGVTDSDFDVRLLDAYRDVGFVGITEHRIDTDLFGAMRDMVTRLFAVPDRRKREMQIERDNYRGFIPLGFFTPNRAEVNGAAPDGYEGFKLHWECPPGHPARLENQRYGSKLHGSNRWVTEIDDMQLLVSGYWQMCDALAAKLLGPIGDHLGVPTAEFASWFDAGLTNMTLLHYPPAVEGASTLSSMHPHKDTNVLTFLHPDPGGGLEVRSRDGHWIQVDPEPDVLIVNVGEMLELWSGGEFVATPHRATNRTPLHRYSFPWFLVPNHDVIVEPLVDCAPGFTPSAMPVGELSTEVWRTNWPDESPSHNNFDLGSLDRTGDS